MQITSKQQYEDRQQKQNIDEHNNLHLGIKFNRLHSNSYNLKYFQYDGDTYLIVNHGEQLILYNAKRKLIKRTIYQTVFSPYINAAFSQKWKLIFLMDETQYLKVYTYDEMILLAEKVEVKGIRHSIDFIYMDQYGAFLALYPQCLKIIYVEINSNHLRSLFANAYKFSIKEVSSKTLNSSYFLQFSNKITRVGQYLIFSNCSDIKIIWHAADRNFSQKDDQKTLQIKDLSQGLINMALNRTDHKGNYARNSIIQIKKICESPQQITQVLFNPQSSLVLCGTSQGILKVYKVNIKNIIATASPGKQHKNSMIQIAAKGHQIFKLKIHNQNPIITIQMYAPKVFLTIGADQYIQVISYDQMASIERFRSSPHLHSIKFLTNSMFLASKTIEFDQFLYTFQVALDYELKVQHNSEIVHMLINKESCLLVLSDNSISLMHLSNHMQKIKKLKQKQLQKINFFNSLHSQKIINETNKQFQLPKQSFVPPRCKSILALQASPVYDKVQRSQNKQQFWILTDQSQIYKYSFTRSKQNFQITEMYELNHFIDTYDHQTKQKVVTMKFVDIVPVYFDSDVKQKKYYPNFAAVEKVKPIAFGCETGQILICSSVAPQKVICRLRNFGQPVKEICLCYFPQQKIQPQDLSLNESMYQSVLLTQKKKICKPHTRRLLIFSSYKQIIVAAISNYEIPQITYKLLLDYVPSFFMKNLGRYVVGIASGSTTKVLFPSHYNIRNIRIWVHSLNIHEGQITCLQHYKGIKSISADDHGKIVIWNLLSQVLASVTTSDRIFIDLCYCWNGKIVFGHSGKIFEINKKILQNNLNSTSENQEKQQQNVINNQNWINQCTIQISTSKASIQLIKQLFKSNLHSHKKQVSTQQLIYKLRHQSPADQQRKNKQMEKYVSNMKKSLLKLTHQSQSKNTQLPFPSSARNKIQENRKNMSKLGRSKSTIKPTSLAYQNKIQPIIEVLQNSRVGRAKTILKKFKDAQQKQIKQLYNFQYQQKSQQLILPQIKNMSATINHERTQQSQKRKKNRNRKYQFLFHFPNAGLYSQLISKNMIQ